MAGLSNELEINGVCVVNNDVFSDPCRRESLLEEASRFREFLPGTTKFVMGGFAALGNPSSYHNPIVRKYREWAMAIVIEKVFRDTVANKSGDWKLEQNIDRMVIREPGETPSAESWHRDEAVIMTTPDDIVYGGWINLDNKPQTFSCVLKSHHTGETNNGGFVKVTKEESARIKSLNLSTKIKIPPGGILIFHENIIHEVLSRKLKHRMVRIHTAWRLTPGESTMSPELQHQLDTQSTVTIKSGQIPPMHAKLHWCNWPDKLHSWSIGNMRPECTEVRTMKSGKRKGESFTTVHENMKSLEEYGFPKYEVYSDREKDMYRPGKSWILRMPGKKRRCKTYTLK